MCTSNDIDEYKQPFLADLPDSTEIKRIRQSL